MLKAYKNDKTQLNLGWKWPRNVSKVNKKKVRDWSLFIWGRRIFGSPFKYFFIEISPHSY